MIKVGLIGCGKLSGSFVDAFKSIPDAKITAAADLSAENLKAVCDACGAVGYTDYKEMVKREEFDFVIVSLPHFLHNEATLFLAENGVNVFLEKPMGLSSKDCEEMISACEKAGVMLWVGHIQRYFGHNQKAKELIDSGKLGKLVRFLEIRNLDYFSESRPKWFLTKRLSGGGIMINLGAHSLDKLKYFCDDAKIVSASGDIHIRDGFDCEDSVSALVKTENGVSGLLCLVGHVPAYDGKTVLYLTDGEIRLGLNKLEYCGADGEWHNVECDSTPSMQREMEAVCNAVRSGNLSPEVTGEYGLDVIRAIKKIYSEE